MRAIWIVLVIASILILSISAIDIVIPQAHAAHNANMRVSAENPLFDNQFNGPMVIEVVIDDPGISDTDESEVEPDVTVNGKSLRMVQGIDGKWYGYFADRLQAQTADATQFAGSGKGLDFGEFCDNNSNLGSGASTVTFTDTVGVAIASEAGTGGVQGTTAIEGSTLCTASTISATNTLHVVRDATAPSSFPSATEVGQLGIDPDAWPFVQLYNFAPTGNVIVEYNKGGVVQFTILTFDSVDNFAGLTLDRTSYPQNSQVHTTITDPQLNIDPTDEDSWTWDTVLGKPYYQLFSEQGLADADGTAGAVGLTGTDLTNFMFEANGVLLLDPDAQATGTDVLNLADNELEVLSGTGDISTKSTASLAAGTQPVTFTELEPNSGIFGNFGAFNLANIVTTPDAPRGAIGTINYNDVPSTILVSNFFGTIDIQPADAEWNSGEEFVVSLTDVDANKNTKVDEDLDLFNPDVQVIPTLQTGNPFTLETLSFANLDTPAAAILDTQVEPISQRAILSANFDITAPAATTAILTLRTTATFSDLKNSINNPLAGFNGFNLFNYDVRSLGASLQGGAVSTVDIDITDGSNVLSLTTGAPLQEIVVIPDANVGDLFLFTDAQPVELRFSYPMPAGSFYPANTGIPVVADFFSFGFNNDGLLSADRVANQIIRFELEETGDNTDVFVGSAEPQVVNQLNILDPTTYQIETIGDEAQFIAIEGLVSPNEAQISYFDLGADGNQVQIADKEPVPPHTGSVAFNLQSYNIGNTVTVTLIDRDIDTDVDLIDIFTTVSDSGDVAFDTIGVAGLPTLSFGPLGQMLEITYDSERWQTPMGACLTALEAITINTGLGAAGFTLIQTGVATDTFQGSFTVPSNWCRPGATTPETTEGLVLGTTYVDFRDGGATNQIVTTGDTADIVEITSQGPEFTISSKADRQQRTLGATWHAGTGQFLVVWSEHPDHSLNGESHSGNDQIRGQLVNLDNSLAGGDFVISEGGNSKDFPEVVHVGNTNRPKQQVSLVVWHDNRDGGKDIWAQLVDSSGSALQGNNFKLSGTDEDLFPKLTYGQIDANNGRFLVVWQRQVAAGDSDVYGQLVRGATNVGAENPGDLISGNFLISAAGTSLLIAPSVAFDPVNDQFLVVWRDDGAVNADGESDIFGQFVNSNGALIGGNFQISSQTGDDLAPEIIYHPEQQEYLVVWTRNLPSTNNFNVNAQRVSPAATLLGGVIDVAVTGGFEEASSPAIQVETGSYIIPMTTGPSVFNRNQVVFEKVSATGNVLGVRQQVATDIASNKGPIKAVYGSTPVGPKAGVTALSEVLVVWRDGRAGIDPLLSQDVFSRMVEVLSDTDGDGLLDNWETNGFVDMNDNGVLDAGDFDFTTLPKANQPNVNHKDIYVELDCMQVDGDNDGVVIGDLNSPGDHTHCPIAVVGSAPTGTTLDTVIATFANAPVANPDGIQGINLHIDIGQLGGGGPIAQTLNADFFTGFETVKAANFAADRSRVFHYALYKHESSGRAEIWGNDFWVGGNYNTANLQALGFIHEFGHNLGLRHGGGENINCKPNYFSIMSYTHTVTGIPPQFRLDYSSQNLPALNEANLNENIALGDANDHTGDAIDQMMFRAGFITVGPNANTAGNVAIDWDNDGTTGETGANVGNNNINNIVGLSCGGSPVNQVLTGFNDWGNIRYNWHSSPNVDDNLHIFHEEDDLTEEMKDFARTQYGEPSLSMTKTGTTSGIPGDPVSYDITIDNAGPGPALDILVEDSWPAGLTFTGSSIVLTTNVLNPDGSRTLEWIIELLDPQESVTITLDGTIDFPPVGDFVTNSVIATGHNVLGEAKPQLSDSIVTNIQADVAIEKSDNIDPVQTGGTLIYTLTVTNNGPAEAENVLVIDTLPSQVTFVSATPDQGSCNEASGIVSCDLGNMANDATVEIDIEVTVNTGLSAAVITNNADATSDDPDPDTSNNSASEQTLILPPSVVTSSSLEVEGFDVDPNLDLQQFRLIFTNDPTDIGKYKQTASNPGQFFHNVFRLGTPVEAVSLDIKIPYPYVSKGSEPIHVYKTVDIINGFFVPSNPIGFSASGTGTTTPSGALGISLSDHSPEDFGGLVTLTVTGTIPDTGLFYVTVHLNYGLKKTVGYVPIINNGAQSASTTILNLADYDFAVMGDITDTQTVQNLNVFKNDPGFTGIVTDINNDNPVPGVTVEFYKPDGTFIDSTETDENGYFFYFFKHTGKAVDYTVKLPDYGVEDVVTLKAVKFSFSEFQINP